jgi:hypothetical protein
MSRPFITFREGDLVARIAALDAYVELDELRADQLRRLEEIDAIVMAQVQAGNLSSSSSISTSSKTAQHSQSVFSCER